MQNFFFLQTHALMNDSFPLLQENCWSSGVFRLWGRQSWEEELLSFIRLDDIVGKKSGRISGMWSFPSGLELLLLPLSWLQVKNNHCNISLGWAKVSAVVLSFSSWPGKRVLEFCASITSCWSFLSFHPLNNSSSFEHIYPHVCLASSGSFTPDK